jgi:hypothetical protein
LPLDGHSSMQRKWAMFSQWYFWVFALVAYPIVVGTLSYLQDMKYKEYIRQYLHGDYPKFPDTYWTHIVPIQIFTIWSVYFYYLCFY